MKKCPRCFSEKLEKINNDVYKCLSCGSNVKQNEFEQETKKVVSNIKENLNWDFEDKFDEINNIAQEYGFANGKAWAETASKKGEITHSCYLSYKNISDLRVRISHGNAKDIFVSKYTYDIACSFLLDIKRSELRREPRPFVFNKPFQHKK